jgi:hypothetical protein
LFLDAISLLDCHIPRSRPASHAAHGLPFVEKYPGLHSAQNERLSRACTSSFPSMQANQSWGVSCNVLGHRITSCLASKREVSGSKIPATRHFASTRLPSAIGMILNDKKSNASTPLCLDRKGASTCAVFLLKWQTCDLSCRISREVCHCPPACPPQKQSLSKFWRVVSGPWGPRDTP